MRILSFLLVTIFLSATAARQQNALPLPVTMADTVEVTVRICNGDLPGKEKNKGIDRNPVVCAYIYHAEKLLQFKVISYDLLYVNNNRTEKYHGDGCNLTTAMKSIINKQPNKAGIDRIFLDNILLQDSLNGQFKLYGRRHIY